MGQIRQIQFRFVPAEDRLLLRINTTGQEELRFWLTRRYVRSLWPVLLRAMACDPQVQIHTAPQHRGTVLSFRQQQALARSDFSRRFQEDATHLPLGETPVLLTVIRLRQGQDGTPVLSMHPSTGHGIDIVLTEHLLHSFCRLLSERTKEAGWDMDLNVSPDHEARPPAPSRLN